MVLLEWLEVELILTTFQLDALVIMRAKRVPLQVVQEAPFIISSVSTTEKDVTSYPPATMGGGVELLFFCQADIAADDISSLPSTEKRKKGYQ